ncbi:MAG: Flp pilus assembly protein CpaB [Firmicutes bacterium]|nr:Flp pilus assembly protein CpaB [Bacillota bacterium]
MKIKKRIYIIAIIAGLITAFLTVSYINNSSNQIPVSLKNSEVIVAISDIPANTEITNNMVTVKEIPASAIQANAIRSISEAVGQITSTNIISGEQIITERLAIGQANASVSYTIPENMRAISIPIKETTGVAGYVSIGDKIDILINDVVSGKNITTTKLQNIIVLEKGVNAGNNLDLQAINSGLTESLTILVTPAQAEVVAYALNMSNPIAVILRNPTDNKIVTLPSYGDNNIASWKGR